LVQSPFSPLIQFPGLCHGHHAGRIYARKRGQWRPLSRRPAAPATESTWADGGGMVNGASIRLSAARFGHPIASGRFARELGAASALSRQKRAFACQTRLPCLSVELASWHGFNSRAVPPEAATH
jgi:hypothetical protein